MKYILFFVVFFVPIFARADVLISEVAWMGTTDSQFEEWIELQNTGSESVSLSGWKIYKAGGDTLLFSLSGSISAGQYLLVCRTTASVSNPLSGSCDLSGTFGGSGLNNTSEYIILKNDSGNSVDEVNASGGWPAGDASTKQTMQKSGSSWITADGTPGQPNASTGSDDEEEEDEENEDDANTEEEEDEEVDTSSSSSATKDTRPTYSKKVVEIKVVDSSVPAGSPVKFSLNTRDLRGVNILRGEFFWNMGDGTERYFAKNEKFEHIYDHEGTYTVYLKYYKTYFEGMEPDIVDKITITISNPSVSISKIHSDGSVEIKNNSSQEVDLSLWTLKDGFGKIFTVPEGTYIAGSKTLVLNSKRINLNPGNIVLLAPSGSFVGNKILIDETASLSQKVSLSSSRSTIYALGDEDGEVLGQNDEKEESINLNDRLGSDKKLETKQKQQSVWIVVFVFMVLISCAVVFFIYRNKKEEEIIEEDEFQLID
jgi:hypothetical protein